MIDTPIVVETAAIQIASIYIEVPRSEVGAAIGQALRDLTAALEAQAIETTGPWLSHHLRQPTETFEFEVCFPVASKVQPRGRVRAGELAARTVARTIHRGPHEGLAAAWGEFSAWIAASHLNPASDFWQRYLTPLETELNRPLVL